MSDAHNKNISPRALVGVNNFATLINAPRKVTWPTTRERQHNPAVQNLNSSIKVINRNRLYTTFMFDLNYFRTSEMQLLDKSNACSFISKRCRFVFCNQLTNYSARACSPGLLRQTPQYVTTYNYYINITTWSSSWEMWSSLGGLLWRGNLRMFEWPELPLTISEHFASTTIRN